jgi:hypothetical protein
MARSIFIILFSILLIGGCSTDYAHQKTPTADMSHADEMTPRNTAVVTSPDFFGATPSPANIPPYTASPAHSPTSMAPIAHPVIHELPGNLYETLFQIPVDSSSIIQYDHGPSAVEGPHAIATLPDFNFLIADPIGKRLLIYNLEGHLLDTIEFSELGIGYVRDMRVKADEILLLETSFQKFYVHRLSLDGDLIASEGIPYAFPVDLDAMDHTIENSLSGIAIDCEGNVLLEVLGGSRLFHLTDVQRQPDNSEITNGYLCNGKLYQVNNSDLGAIPQVIAGSIIYETSLTIGLGGLHILDIFSDRGIYIERDDVMPGTPLQVDLTVHFLGFEGGVNGVARVPLEEYYYTIYRKLAIGYDGEVYALLPRSGSLDVIRLNFYSSLEPLVSDAVVPQISIQHNP